MGARITSQRFVGRELELDAMIAAVDAAAEGRPGLVLVTGEAGIGKTRLTEEFERRIAAAPKPPLVLRGDAVPPVDGGELPYAPLVVALRPLVEDDHPAREALTDSDRAELATLWPTLAHDPAGPERNALPDRLRLFESLRALLAGAETLGPVVLVIEDGHWADAGTLAFLDFLVRSMRADRLAVVLTHRSDEPDQSEALRRRLSELHRHSRVHHLELGRFDREALGEAVADILGAPPEPAALGRLLERSDGNPLYAEELLAAGVDGRGAPPATLGDAFRRRVERLGQPARRLTGSVAVARSLDEAALAALAELSPDDLAAALREAIAAQVLVADGSGGFRFRHALLRESVHAELLPGERRALHLALARHRETELAAATGTDREFELALQVAAQYAAADDRPAALRATVDAAELSRRAQAVDRTAELLATALELWPQVREAERPAATTRTELLIEAGVVQATLGRMQEARSTLLAALDAVDESADPRAAAAILFEQAKAEQELGRVAEATACVRRAQGLVAADAADPLRLAIEAWLAMREVHAGTHRTARPSIEAALQTAVRAGNREMESELRAMLGMALMRSGDPEGGLAEARRAYAMAQAAGQQERAHGIQTYLGAMLSYTGRQQEAVDLFRSALEATPASRTTMRDRLNHQLSIFAFRAGEWELARASLDAIGGETADFVHRGRLLRSAELAAAIGDYDRAAAELDECAELAAQTSESMIFCLHAALSADLHLRRGELERAASIVAAASERLRDYPPEAVRAIDVHVYGIAVHGALAQRARDLRDPAARDAAVARARSHLARIEAVGPTAHPWELAQLSLATVLTAAAEGRVRAADWTRPASDWDRLGVPYAGAVVRLLQAETHVREGDREAAGRVAAEALAVAERLGSRWLVDELRALGDRARLTLPGADGGDDPGDPAASARTSFGLSARELQVLARIADGETNRQIAEALFISDKTVSAHVSRILAKLDAQGRTEAAALAHRHGLIDGVRSDRGSAAGD